MTILLTAFERVMLKALTGIQVTLDQVVKDQRVQGRLLNKILLTGVGIQGAETDELPDGVELPLASVEELEELEHKLKTDTGLRSILVSIFCCACMCVNVCNIS